MTHRGDAGRPRGDPPLRADDGRGRERRHFRRRPDPGGARSLRQHSADARSCTICRLGVGHYGVFNGSKFPLADRAAHRRFPGRSTRWPRAGYAQPMAPPKPSAPRNGGGVALALAIRYDTSAPLLVDFGERAHLRRASDCRAPRRSRSRTCAMHDGAPRTASVRRAILAAAVERLRLAQAIGASGPSSARTICADHDLRRRACAST